MAKYFPCKIYNTEDRRKNEPAFAILSMTKNFSLEDAIERVKRVPPKNIFIIVNGQQSLNLCSNDTKDEQFGQALTGIDRIGKTDDSGIWKGDFEIHTTSSYRSVASALFDEYGSCDLIIDVVNAKYEWAESAKKNKKAFDNFCEELKEILNAIGDCSSLRFFIAGFSRGGMFSLRLAEWLVDNKYGKERIVVTIDPVQNKKKEKKEWDVAWADWKVRIGGGHWEISDGYKVPVGFNEYRFPILKATAEKHYNVFERDSVWFNKPVNVPIGSAVKEAIAPPEKLTGKRADTSNKKYKKLPISSPYDQFDILTQNHTEMPRKYRNWVISIAHKHFSNNSGHIQSIKLTPSHGVPGKEVIITRTGNPMMGGIVVPRRVFIDKKRVKSQLDKKRKCVHFRIPEKIVPGEKHITLGLHPRPFNSAIFIVTPFITSNEPHQGFAGATVKVRGKIAKNDIVLLDGNEIKTDFHGDKKGSFLSFKLPKNISIGEKRIQVQREGRYLSNSLTFIVCDLIGNRNTKELHKKGCAWLSLMKPSNKQLICSTLDKPKEHGYDNCHWCLGGSLR